MDISQREDLMQTLVQRVTASLNLDEQQQAITRQVMAQVEELLSSDEFGRKFRFNQPQEADYRLHGTKFHRHGFGPGDIEHLYDLQMALRNFNPGKYKGPSEELENAFSHVSAAQYVPMEKIREMDREALDNMFPRIPLSEFSEEDRKLVRRGKYELTGAYQRAVRAMDTAESGYGSQLVGAEYVGELWTAGRYASRVFALLTPFEMMAPTAYLPVEADIPEMLFVPENTTASWYTNEYATSKTGSQRVQVDAKKFVIHQLWSGEMQEDAIIAYVPFLRRQALLSLAHYSDSLVLNGDTTNAATGNINLDDADPADTKHYLAFDGIRHAGLVDNVNNQADMGGAITWAALMNQYGRMWDQAFLQDWGHPVMLDDVVHITDVLTGDKIGQLNEVVNWRIQQGRSLYPGQVAEVIGRPVISSPALQLTEADGKVSTTGSNNIKGQVVAFNRRGFVPGWRRRVQVEVERLAGADQNRIIYSLRMGLGRFSPTGAASGIEAADVIYNITI